MAEGLASAMLGAFEQGYTMPGRMRALDEARKKYGERANDPGLFSALEQENRASEQHQSNMATQQQNREIAGNQESRAQQGHDYDMGAAENERKQKAVLGLVQGLRSARDSGQDIGAAFDQQRETLKVLGVADEDIPAMREAIVQNPAVLDDYLAALQGQSGTTPKATPASATKGPSAEEIETEILKFDDVLSRIESLQDPERQDTARSILNTPGFGKAWEGGFGQFGAFPGTPAAGYVNDLEALVEGDIRAIAFETLKGGGQITEKESEFARDAITRLNRSLSYEDYQRELENVKSYITRLRDAARRRANGENVPDITNTGTAPAPAGAPTFSEQDFQRAPQVSNPEDLEKLPSGTLFVAPDGTYRVKP